MCKSSRGCPGNDKVYVLEVQDGMWGIVENGTGKGCERTEKPQEGRGEWRTVKGCKQLKDKGWLEF
jgi:hypothetical protein